MSYYWVLYYETSILEDSTQFDSINDFMIIRFLLTFIKGAIRASALSFRIAFSHKWLTWSSNFNSWSIVIPRRTSALLETMGKPSITAVVASARLIMRWLLSLFAFMKLLLNRSNSSDEDVSSALMTLFFCLPYKLQYHPHSLQCLSLPQNRLGHINVYWIIKDRVWIPVGHHKIYPSTSYMHH